MSWLHDKARYALAASIPHVVHHCLVCAALSIVFHSGMRFELSTSQWQTVANLPWLLLSCHSIASTSRWVNTLRHPLSIPLEYFRLVRLRPKQPPAKRIRHRLSHSRIWRTARCASSAQIAQEVGWRSRDATAHQNVFGTSDRSG